MKKLLVLVGILTLIGCGKPNQISHKVDSRLNERDWLPERVLVVTPEEKAAMDFLYAYMGMGDAVDFGEDLYLANVKSSLLAMSEMPWKESVSEELFYHFVLPVRVNNENLDKSRVDFYVELKDRVKGLSMEDAILEVNHWCHEKVVYVPNDSRTSSPSASVRNAQGRCGEESTFTVAALRSVGIPARQIYTPRWAHTDDNHAWVEAWANGKWHYLGACEPEPVLNCGWFDAPAKRGMLMFTKVFGDYNGSEEVIDRTDGYTEINVTKNYAPVKKNVIKVVEESGKAVEGANVLYTIYNYAQLYPAVRKVSDANGQSSFSTGVGDVVVVANKDGVYGRAKLVARDSVVTIVLNKKQGDAYVEEFEIVPPVEMPVNNGVTPEQREANDARWAQEDSIRGAYVATFATLDQAKNLASELGVAQGRVWRALENSRGNHAEIVKFLRNAPKKDIGVALDLLEVISVKDLKDTPSNILNSHLVGALKYKDLPKFKEFILNPRVDDELIVDYRGAFDKGLSYDEVMNLVDSVVLRPELNPAKLRISPVGVAKLGMADKPALERYAITMLRSNGIAAGRQPLTGLPEMFNGKSWVLIEFDQWAGRSSDMIEGGFVNVGLKKNDFNADPKFYTHFTLAELIDGEFVQLDMSKLDNDMGEGLSYKTIFNGPLPLYVGTYELVTGTRMSDGSVAARSVVFDVKDGKTTQIEMVMPENKAKLQVIAGCDPETLYVPQGKDEPKSILSTTGRGYFILAVIDAKKEPTTHFLRGLESINADLNTWERPIVLVLEDKGKLKGFKITEFPNLPDNVYVGYDYDQKVLDMLYSMVKLDKNTQLPIVIIGDTFGRVVYKSTGYNTSIGEQIKDVVKQL